MNSPIIVKNVFYRFFLNEAMGANAIYRIPITEADKQTHVSFNGLVVTNTSSSDLKAVRDNDITKAIIVPAKGSVVFNFTDDNIKYTDIYIEELSGNAVSADAVSVIVTKSKYIPIQINEGNS